MGFNKIFLQQIFRISILFFFLLSYSVTSGQSDSLKTKIQVDSLSSDSIASVAPTKEKKKKKRKFIKRFFQEDYPSPRKAIILTGVLPGLGQIYNRKYWYLKLPLVYAAFGGLIYSIDYNTREYRHFRDEYKLLVNSDPDVNEQSIYFGFNPSLIKNRRDQHDKWKQMSYIGIGLAYILTAAEAYTTAHLLSFDVSDDLSLRLKPSFDFTPQQGTTLGFGVQLQLGRAKPAPTPSPFFPK